MASARRATRLPTAAVAARNIAQLEGAKLVDQEKVPETAEVEKVMGKQ